MTKSFFFFYMQLGKSKSGKSSLFFFRQAECTIFEHPCFWWNILEMQRLLAELGISESYLDQRLHLVGDLYFFESFIRGSLEVYTSVLWSFDSLEMKSPWPILSALVLAASVRFCAIHLLVFSPISATKQSKTPTKCLVCLCCKGTLTGRNSHCKEERR